ncbi:hypothetical protein ACHAWF_008729, partial [Thalassiosira exigua]
PIFCPYFAGVRLFSLLTSSFPFDFPRELIHLHSFFSEILSNCRQARCPIVRPSVAPQELAFGAMMIDGGAGAGGQSDDGANDVAGDANANAPAAEGGSVAPAEREAPPRDAHDARTAAAAPSGSGNFVPNNFVPASAVEPAPANLSCRFCPHGAFAAVPLLLATFAWFVRLSQDGCDYARLTGPTVAEITDDPDVPFVDLGFGHYREPVFQDDKWVVDFDVPCEPYNPDVVTADGVWTFAKITSFLGLTLGGAGALFLWFSSCVFFKRNTWRWAGYEVSAAVACQALTFSWFGTSLCRGESDDGKDSCAMQYGARADILACCLWAVAVSFIFCMYPLDRANKASNDYDRRQLSEVELADQTDYDRRQLSEVELADQTGERRAAGVNEHEII